TRRMKILRLTAQDDKSLPTEARLHAGRDVLALDPGHRLAGNERDAGVRVTDRLPSRLDERRTGGDAKLRHLHGILLRGGGDRSGGDVSDALAATVHRHEHHTLLLPGGLERLVGTSGGRLVDRV